MGTEAKVTWIGPGLRLVGEASSGPAIVIDHALPGEDRQETGPRPMELLLIGLAGCTAMDVVSILQRMRQPLDGLEVHASAERAPDHPKVYTRIHLEFVIKGKGIKESAVERAINLSQTTYCSASAMLSKTAEITTSYRIVETE